MGCELVALTSAPQAMHTRERSYRVAFDFAGRAVRVIDSGAEERQRRREQLLRSVAAPTRSQGERWRAVAASALSHAQHAASAEETAAEEAIAAESARERTRARLQALIGENGGQLSNETLTGRCGGMCARASASAHSACLWQCL